ncbi:MAG: hypothetical protein Kow00108_06730 [Calditrichia bacterium]
MPREKGFVIRTENNKIHLGLTGGDHCSACAAKSVCISKESSRELVLENTLHLKEGDQVELEYTEKQKISISLALFLVPLLFLIFGYAVGFLFDHRENSAIIGAIIGLGIGLLFPVLINKINEKKGFLLPVIIKKIERDNP